MALFLVIDSTVFQNERPLTYNIYAVHAVTSGWMRKLFGEVHSLRVDLLRSADKPATLSEYPDICALLPLASFGQLDSFEENLQDSSTFVSLVSTFDSSSFVLLTLIL
jgi:hypothetical protein